MDHAPLGSVALVDGRTRDEHRPTFTELDVFAWSPGSDGVVRADQRIGVHLHFDGVVEAFGTPEFMVGTERRKSTLGWTGYGSMGVTRSIIRLDHIVHEDDFDSDGFSVADVAWTSVSFRDQWGNPVPVDIGDLAVSDQGAPISGKSEGEPATLVGVSFPSYKGGAAFGIGETIRVEFAFDNPVNVDGALTLQLGRYPLPCDLDDTRVRLVCEREVGEREGANNIVLKPKALRPSDALKDDNGNVVDLGLAAFVDEFPALSVDGSAPAIERMVITSKPVAGNTYGAGARVEVVVRFGEPVQVTGGPELALSIGDDTRLAQFDRSAGANALRFRYVVSSSDLDGTGLAIPANAIRLNGGSISDLAGNPADLSHAALADRRLHQVDGRVPDDSSTPVQIWITGEPAATVGSPSAEATSSLKWQMRSGWAAQPKALYRVRSDHPSVRIGRASGWVSLGQSVTNSLAMSCPSGSAVNARLTIEVEGTTAPVPWDVLCRDGRIEIGDVEFFQGPLSARFGTDVSSTHAKAVSMRQGVLRASVVHDGIHAPEVGVSVSGAISAARGDGDIAVDFAGTRTTKESRTSTYLAALAPAAITTEGGFRVEIDPLDWLDADVGPARVISFSALEPLDLPVFKPVLVPVEILATAPDVSGDPHRFLAEADALMPVGEMELTVGRSLRFDPTSDERTKRHVNADRLLETIAAHWNRTGKPDEFYVGIVEVPAGWELWSYSFGDTVGGQAGGSVSHNHWTGKWSALTVAHEIGHNFGLAHAPCGDPPGVDSEFPFKDGRVGPESGWSKTGNAFVSPEDGRFDIMSYCDPKYVSEYHYQKAMAWGDRIREALQRNARGTSVAADTDAVGESPSEPINMGHSTPVSLALSGSVDIHGTWSLFDSATSTQPGRIDEPGEFTIALYDDAGVELHRQSLASEVVSHSNIRMWAVRAPIQSREVRAVRVRDASGDLLLDANVALPGRTLPQPLR